MRCRDVARVACSRMGPGNWHLTLPVKYNNRKDDKAAAAGLELADTQFLSQERLAVCRKGPGALTKPLGGGRTIRQRMVPLCDYSNTVGA